jgi:hypothetical protein
MRAHRPASILGLLVVMLYGLTACGSPAEPPTSSVQQSALGATTKPPSTGKAAATPSTDEIVHSDNIKVIANVRLTAPFDAPEAWGTDLAFQGNYAFVGNYYGFTVHDISDPAKPKVVTRVLCPGGQNDISVSGDLLFLSIDEPRDAETCDSDSARPDGNTTPWEGIRIFDISDKADPKYVKAVATRCGSHTHAILPGAGKLLLYVSAPGPEPGSASCPAPHDGIAIVEVPLNSPASARVVADPPLFADRSGGSGEIGGCHDITLYPEKKLAAAACFGDGYLIDIADPVRPKVIHHVTDEENFSIWHSATFNNAGTKVVFSDELGGGISATCSPGVAENKGADAIYEISADRKLVKHAYFKIPREQTTQENCVAHNGSLIPVAGKDIMVQGWYMGGVSVFDFTDSDNPKEIAYFERGPLPAGEHLGGSWSAYYYNGYIYSSDITKGLDVLQIDDPLTDAAAKVRMTELNVQTQGAYG